MGTDGENAVSFSLFVDWLMRGLVDAWLMLVYAFIG